VGPLGTAGGVEPLDAAGLAGDLAGSVGVGADDPRLPGEALAVLVSPHLPHVHRLDCVPLLRRLMDDDRHR
jgi:hypothetical protein